MCSQSWMPDSPKAGCTQKMQVACQSSPARSGSKLTAIGRLFTRIRQAIAGTFGPAGSYLCGPGSRRSVTFAATAPQTRWETINKTFLRGG